MKSNTVKKLINTLAQSQGTYSRLYNDLEYNNSWEDFTEYLNNNNVVTELDIILLLES